MINNIFKLLPSIFAGLLLNLMIIAQAKAVSIDSVVDGVAYVNVSVGSDIDDAFLLLETYIPTDPLASSGVVNVISNSTFSSEIQTKNNITLNIVSGVELGLIAVDIDYAINLSNTTNSGVTGGGTLNINGNSLFGIYANAPQNPIVGNLGGPTTEPLTIKGWRQGVGIFSSSTVAATNVRLENLEVRSAHSSDVTFPIIISSRPGANGLWVNGATLKDIKVDGSDTTGLGGEFSETNQFTADQVTLQGVWNASLDNIFSVHGGENNITLAWGTKNATINNSVTEFADGHGFNIGGGSYAIDVDDVTGFATGMSVKGSTSNALATVWLVFPPNRIWVEFAENARFEAGETLTLADGSLSPTASIISSFITRDISLTNVVGDDNGQNYGDNLDGTGSPVAFSDFYVQQAENVSINGIARSLGHTDLSAEHFGVFIGSSTYVLGDMSYEGYGSGQIPVGEFGDSTVISLNQGDSIINSAASGGEIIGTNNHDVFNTSNNTDILEGRDGNDIMDGQGGNDTLDGGSGFDTINGGTGNDIISGGSDNDILDGGDGIDEINGNSGDDRIVGGDMADTLNGDSGKDNIFGGEGNDIISGGEDNDTIRGENGEDIISGDDGNDTIIGGADKDTINGGNGLDRLYGNSGNDEINGQEGNDIIYAGSGLDIVSGGLGIDRINGNGENDTLDGNEGNDIIFGGYGEDIIRGGDGNDSMYGQADNDEIFGSFGNDLLNGGGGDDYLYGNDGIDRLFGSIGSDVMFGGDGEDTLHGGTEDDTLHGNNDNDTLIGYTGNDTLNGGNGDDSLRGGAGNDILSGNAGADTFIFRTSWGNDTIKDFANGTEILDMRTIGITDITDLTITRGPGDSGVLITYGADSILLENRVPSQMDPTDFLF